MLYADSCYLGKYYLAEPGSDEVRRTFHGQEVMCLELGRVELVAAFHRNLRRGTITSATFLALFNQFEHDDQAGLWTWLPLTHDLLNQALLVYRELPPSVFLRAFDAMHLVAASHAHAKEIYSNDRHLLAAARRFGLRGINVIASR